ncbi:MAG: MATE family efflux transporter, partial [Chitinophagaceae bacterium]
MTKSLAAFGTGNIKKLLRKQAVPASIGILFLTVNLLVDTILVGRWVGANAIAALTVTAPVSFFIASLGLAIGIGGSSVLSRALGSDNREKAEKTVAHQIMLTFILSSLIVVVGLVFSDEMLQLFGAQGSILESAKAFYFPIL